MSVPVSTPVSVPLSVPALGTLRSVPVTRGSGRATQQAALPRTSGLCVQTAPGLEEVKLEKFWFLLGSVAIFSAQLCYFLLFYFFYFYFTTFYYFFFFVYEVFCVLFWESFCLFLFLFVLCIYIHTYLTLAKAGLPNQPLDQVMWKRPPGRWSRGTRRRPDASPRVGVRGWGRDARPPGPLGSPGGISQPVPRGFGGTGGWGWDGSRWHHPMWTPRHVGGVTTALAKPDLSPRGQLRRRALSSRHR